MFLYVLNQFFDLFRSVNIEKSKINNIIQHNYYIEYILSNFFVFVLFIYWKKFTNIALIYVYFDWYEIFEIL